MNKEEELIDDDVTESCCRGFKTKLPPPEPPGSCTVGTCRSGPQGAARCGRTGCGSPKNLGKLPAMQENASRTSNGGCGCKGAPSSPSANGNCHTEILNGKPSPIAMGVNSLSGRSSENIGRKGSSTSLDQQTSSTKNQDQLVHAYNALDSATDKGPSADCIEVKRCDKLATTSLASNSLNKPASAKLETGHSSSDGLENASHVIGHSGKELTNDRLQEKPARTNHVAESNSDVEPATEESGPRT